MDSPTVTRDAETLVRLLDEQTFDLRRLDLEGFRRWLKLHLVHWQTRSVFAQRVRVRDLRRAHPRLHTLEEERRALALNEAATPQSIRLRQLERGLTGAGKAVVGLSKALETASPEKQAVMERKLDAFKATLRSLRKEREQLIESSPQLQALQRLDVELRQLRAAVGLDREEEVLARLQRQQGNRLARSGDAFERLAQTLTEAHILPDLLDGEPSGRPRVLTGVRLGSADAEFDQLVVRGSDAEAVEVLAVVEVKRNINDVAHGFRRRQVDLAWLTGDRDRYDPAAYRTRRFPSGHFDRESPHRQDGQTFLLGPSSFRRFGRDPSTGLLLDGLYFVTRAGPLWGTSAAALGRMASRAASDRHWDPAGDAYLGEFLAWCQALTHPVETPDVLRLYAATPERGRRVLLVHRGRED
jgi:hypothetical protein